MATVVNWNGTNYSIPAAGEVGWDALSDFLIALGNNAQTTNFQQFATRVATSSPVTVVAASDCVVITDLTVAGAVAVNLPAGVENQVFCVIDGKGDAHTNNITITPDGAETIEAGASYVINVARGAAIMVFKSGNWSLLSAACVRPPSGAVTTDSLTRWNADGSLKGTLVDVDDSGATVATSTTLSFSQTVNRTISFPDATATVATLAEAETLTNKTMGSTNTLTGATAASFSNGGTVTLPSGATTLVGRDTADEGANRLQNKDLDASTVDIVDPADTTKQIDFDASGGATGTKTTFAASQTADRVITAPDAAGTMALIAAQQTLSNKVVQGGTADANHRIELPKAGTAALDALAGTEASLYYDTDLKQVRVDDGTSLISIGAGGVGELNVVADPSTATNWSTTGSGPAVATTTTAGDLPLGGVVESALQLSITGNAAEASNYAGYSWSMPEALKGKKLKVEFYLRPGSNFVDDEWTISVYEGANRVNLSTDDSGVTYIPNADGKFTTTFDADDSTSYTVRFARVSGATAAVLNVANVIVGPGTQPQGAVVENLGDLAFTFAGFGTPVNQFFDAYRVGSNLRVKGRWINGSVDGSTAAIILPSGLSIDTAKISTLQPGTVVGNVYQSNNNSAVNDILTSTLQATLWSDGTTSDRVFFAYQDDTTNNLRKNAGNQWSGNGWQQTAWFEIPIAEWAGSGTVNVAQNDVEYAYNTSTTDADDTTSFGYGPGGVTTPVALSADRQKTVRFKTPIQATDAVVLEFARDPAGPWTEIDHYDNEGVVQGLQRFNNTSYGMGFRLSTVGANEIVVRFGQYASTASATTYAGAGFAWSTSLGYWRAKKVASGQAVGFGLAAANQAGLLESYQTETKAADNSFTVGSFVFTKVGNVVTITADGALTHSSSATPTTSSGFLPAAYRPSGGTVATIFSYTAAVISAIEVQTDGTIGLVYRNYSGNGTVQTSSVNIPTISYTL